MIFNIFILTLVAGIGVYVYLDFKQKKLMIAQIIKNTDNIANVEGDMDKARKYIGTNLDNIKKTVKHGDKITIRSTAHQKHRLQDHGNRYGKFENANRGGWEQLLIEKCGMPGIGDNQACW